LNLRTRSAATDEPFELAVVQIGVVGDDGIDLRALNVPLVPLDDADAVRLSD
jgi:hypothetical protein